jgi:Flp pilus assembly protein protease CpaA
VKIASEDSHSQHTGKPAGRALSVVLALLVLLAGGFVTLVLVWWASWNNGAWAASPSDRRQRFIGAAVAFALTIGLAGLIMWSGFRSREENDD